MCSCRNIRLDSYWFPVLRDVKRGTCIDLILATGIHPLLTRYLLYYQFLSIIVKTIQVCMLYFKNVDKTFIIIPLHLSLSSTEIAMLAINLKPYLINLKQLNLLLNITFSTYRTVSVTNMHGLDLQIAVTLTLMSSILFIYVCL